MATETLEIVFIDEGMTFGSSVIFSLAGGTSIEKCKFVARVSSPNGTYDLASISYRETYLGKASVGRESKESREALEWLCREIENNGWQLIERGSPHWYSHRYQPQHKTANTTSTQRTSITSRDFDTDRTMLSIPFYSLIFIGIVIFIIGGANGWARGLVIIGVIISAIGLGGIAILTDTGIPGKVGCLGLPLGIVLLTFGLVFGVGGLTTLGVIVGGLGTLLFFLLAED